MTMCRSVGVGASACEVALEPVIFRIFAVLLLMLGIALVFAPELLQRGFLQWGRPYGLRYGNPDRAMPQRRLRIYGLLTLLTAGMLALLSFMM